MRLRRSTALHLLWSYLALVAAAAAFWFGYEYGRDRLVDGCEASSGFTYGNDLYLCIGPVESYQIYENPQPLR